MFSLSKTVRSAPLHVPFERIADHILGSSYELSLVFIGDTRMRNLNKQHRRKDRPTNVLAFPLSGRMGEIFIDLAYAKREARKLNVTLKHHVAFLFIHACLHLKGYEHGTKMETRERMTLKKFCL